MPFKKKGNPSSFVYPTHYLPSNLSLQASQTEKSNQWSGLSAVHSSTGFNATCTPHGNSGSQAIWDCSAVFAVWAKEGCGGSSLCRCCAERRIKNPAVIVIHFCGNDLGLLSGCSLLATLRWVLHRILLIFPRTTIVYHNIIQCQEYRSRIPAN